LKVRGFQPDRSQSYANLLIVLTCVVTLRSLTVGLYACRCARARVFWRRQDRLRNSDSFCINDEIRRVIVESQGFKDDSFHVIDHSRRFNDDSPSISRDSRRFNGEVRRGSGDSAGIKGEWRRVTDECHAVCGELVTALFPMLVRFCWIEPFTRMVILHSRLPRREHERPVSSSVSPRSHRMRLVHTFPPL